MHDFVNAFMGHLHLYEGAAVALVLAAALFLIFLARRYAATKYTIRNPGK